MIFESISGFAWAWFQFVLGKDLCTMTLDVHVRTCLLNKVHASSQLTDYTQLHEY
jgi:hypothetical protein